ncbi:OLC1v1029197C1 [Oldenlandia corymbosa var. corymbosa]|uniref:Phosphorylated adapter RNA export protein n=1 Tax=Oldenlandia corymbosa var. corymbosa TaxID=529605 RepID=A0AAV1CDE7_OLDCO|nr:OLC1v1029197C1 [Oldenlandia corymbosa var. corymbosa]
MEGGGLDNVLDTVLEDENFEDVEMLDVEDGELFEQDPEVENEGGNPVTDLKALNVEGDANMVQKKNKKKKRKNKKKRGSSIPNASNISRFVPDVCRRLKEKKSYLVWAAVNCLGVPALSDLVKEVDAIQACGGQQTADGRRFRTGGGILWNILKVRDPNAYKEIMRRGKEFEVCCDTFFANFSVRNFFVFIFTLICVAWMSYCCLSLAICMYGCLHGAYICYQTTNFMRKFYS